MKNQAKEKDPIRDFKEWQEHRYDPGYFTGGNIHPLLKAGRPNKYGFVLILGGLGILVLALFENDHSLYWYYMALQVCFALLMITAGVKLIKTPSYRRSGKKNR
jgi:hypothetical protein